MRTTTAVRMTVSTRFSMRWLLGTLLLLTVATTTAHAKEHRDYPLPEIVLQSVVVVQEDNMEDVSHFNRHLTYQVEGFLHRNLQQQLRKNEQNDAEPPYIAPRAAQAFHSLLMNGNSTELDLYHHANEAKKAQVETTVTGTVQFRFDPHTDASNIPAPDDPQVIANLQTMVQTAFAESAHDLEERISSHHALQSILSLEVYMNEQRLAAIQLNDTDMDDKDGWMQEWQDAWDESPREMQIVALVACSLLSVMVCAVCLCQVQQCHSHLATDRKRTLSAGTFHTDPPSSLSDIDDDEERRAPEMVVAPPGGTTRATNSRSHPSHRASTAAATTADPDDWMEEFTKRITSIPLRSRESWRRASSKRSHSSRSASTRSTASWSSWLGSISETPEEDINLQQHGADHYEPTFETIALDDAPPQSRQSRGPPVRHVLQPDFNPHHVQRGKIYL